MRRRKDGGEEVLPQENPTRDGIKATVIVKAIVMSGHKDARYDRLFGSLICLM